MKLTSIFRDYGIGDRCDGAVLLYNLNGPQLVKKGVLVVQQMGTNGGNEAIFCYTLAKRPEEPDLPREMESFEDEDEYDDFSPFLEAANSRPRRQMDRTRGFKRAS